jgi:hypothetical protein
LSLYFPLGQELTQEPAFKNLPAGQSRQVLVPAPEQVLPFMKENKIKIYKKNY